MGSGDIVEIGADLYSMVRKVGYYTGKSPFEHKIPKPLKHQRLVAFSYVQLPPVT